MQLAKDWQIWGGIWGRFGGLKTVASVICIVLFTVPHSIMLAAGALLICLTVLHVQGQFLSVSLSATLWINHPEWLNHRLARWFVLIWFCHFRGMTCVRILSAVHRQKMIIWYFIGSCFILQSLRMLCYLHMLQNMWIIGLLGLTPYYIWIIAEMFCWILLSSCNLTTACLLLQQAFLWCHLFKSWLILMNVHSASQCFNCSLLLSDIDYYDYITETPVTVDLGDWLFDLLDNSKWVWLCIISQSHLSVPYSRPSFPQFPDVCDPNPCLNGGSCQMKSSTEFMCLCIEPYTGKRCQKGRNLFKTILIVCKSYWS